MPIGFYDDWVKSAAEESKHFNLVCDCLEAIGSHYGALPAHAGMWRAAEDTKDDLNEVNVMFTYNTAHSSVPCLMARFASSSVAISAPPIK